jgi:hypothetical protein
VDPAWNETFAFELAAGWPAGINVEIEVGQRLEVRPRARNEIARLTDCAQSIGTGEFHFGPSPRGKSFQQVAVPLRRFQQSAGHVVLSMVVG